jgi:type IV pilus assembly protein PilX
MKRHIHLLMPVRDNQRGAALVVTLLMLIVILMLGISAAQLALQGEKASRNDRDRQIAFQAAEAALMDAELDIENSPDTARSRSAMFSKDSVRGFHADDGNICGAGESNISLGLCERQLDGSTPAWITVDFDDASPGTMQSVPFGKFTGQRFPTGNGALPSQPPRYVIELMTYNRAGESADRPSYFYRITAIGYGPRSDTPVVLQTFYRKES